jgi:hypothetical protein
MTLSASRPSETTCFRGPGPALTPFGWGVRGATEVHRANLGYPACLASNLRLKVWGASTASSK